MLRRLVHQIALMADRLLTPLMLIIASIAGFLVTTMLPYLRPMNPRDLAVVMMLAPAFLAVFTVMAIAQFIEAEAAKIALRLHALEIHFQVNKAMEDTRALRLAIRAVRAGTPDIYTLPDPEEFDFELPEDVEETSDPGHREHIKIGGTA